MAEAMINGDAILITPTYGMVYVVGAIIICFLGAGMSLFFAVAALQIKLRGVVLFAAASFGLQCVFSLHFMGLKSMDLGIAWGFDVLWTLASIVMVLVFGTWSITLALSLRQGLEPMIGIDFPGYPHDPSTYTIKFYARYCTPLTSTSDVILLIP